MRALGAGIVLAALACSAAPARVQERFDLRDWTRKAIPNSSTVFFECAAPAQCGAGSAVSGRLVTRPEQPLTVERQRALQAQVARRMREQSEGRLKDVEVGETREQQIDSMPVIVSEKRLIAASGAARTMVDGIMVGKTRAYSVVASGLKADSVRNNFNAFARIVALILEQSALEPPSVRPSPNPSPRP